MAVTGSLAAEIERELIALITTEALAKRKVEGKPLGWSKGRQSARLKLDAKEAEIRNYLSLGIQLGVQFTNSQVVVEIFKCLERRFFVQTRLKGS